jgi:biotin-(acetyl-CoA carboxylase) ligase
MSGGCIHGTLVMAETQSKGMGRGGRSWASQPTVQINFLYSLDHNTLLFVFAHCSQFLTY